MHQNAISLKSLHTFRLPYSASEVITVTKAEDIETVEGNFLVLGEGSNTIFTCDFSRPIVRIAIEHIEIKETEDSYDLTVGAGVNWHHLVTHTLQNGMPGLENLALIPGSVGAAPVQNIGAYGVEVGEFITSVTAWDRELERWQKLNRADCAFGYRDSVFKRNPNRYVITEVNFRLPKAWQARLGYGALADISKTASPVEIMQAVVAIRNSKLPNPVTIPNAGSFFKNPEVSKEVFARIESAYPQVAHYPLESGTIKLAAGWLIDQLGLKGYQCGGAAVHVKQALVLINKHDARGSDVLELARYVKQSVATTFGVELEAEVRLLDANGLIEL